MSFSMKDKVVIITGGSKGIGLGIVTVFAKEQAKVVFTGRNEETGKQTQQQLKEQGLDTLFLASDVSAESSMRNLMKQVYDTYGRIDILLHNAGIYPEVKLVDMTLEDWDKVHNINLRGTFIAIKEVIPYMKQQNKGKIVITSSITGPKTGNPGLAHYAASKAGVNGLIRTACLELAPWNINVNGVEPGNIMTPGMTDVLGEEYIKAQEASIPSGKLGVPEDIAYAAMFLASEEANYITGQTIVVDGGQILPESKLEIN